MIRIILLLSTCMIVACNAPVVKEPPAETEETQSNGFFPVTNYLRGQIAEIKSRGFTPLRIDSTAGRKDSTWVKLESLDSTFKEFLEPEIDSQNLIKFYKEDKFADQTLGTYTFTYTSLPNLPEANALKRWDVYISQETSAIKSIYFVKKFADKELQLTWESNRGSKQVSIATDKTGRQFVEYEQVIIWNFE